MKYILTDRTLTVLIDDFPHHVDNSNRNWDRLKEIVTTQSGTPEEVLALMSPAAAIDEATQNYGQVELRGGSLYFQGNSVHTVLAERIRDIIEAGQDVLPWIKFAENVYSNPAPFSQEELYLFLEKADLPITPDGHFLAYKNVRTDYRDIHSGTFDNSIGSVCEMPREEVDPDRFRTCSTGLHFCSKAYLPHFAWGGRTVVVKINPADVVSIPSDYDNTKGRCWRYEVVGEIPQEVVQTYVWSPVFDDEDLEDYDDWYDDELEDELEDEAVVEEIAPLTTATIKTKSRFARWFKRS